MAKVLVKSDSHTGLENKLRTAVAAKHGTGSEYSYMGNTSVHDVWPDKVVHTIAAKAGKVFASPYKLDEKGAVTLGEPTEVQPAYKPMAEAFQGVVGNEINAMQEAAYDKSSGKLKITVIAPGFNTSKSRFYPKSTLVRDHKVFNNSKMFMNHQTAQEAKARPEGNVQDWVANLIETSVSPDGTIKGVAQVHDPAFKAKLEGLQESGLLHEMGVSIRAAGVQQPADMNGVKTSFVESFTVCKSVDFVTYPGAGGKVEMLEADATDIDFVTPDQLAQRRPDLVKHFTTAAEEAAQAMATEQELTTENNALKEKVRVLEESAGRAIAKAALDTKLAASSLPDKSKDRLRTQFKESATEAGMQEAIDGEVAYLKDLGVGTTVEKGKGKIKAMGESAQATKETADLDGQRKRLEQAWRAGGMTEAEASNAADTYFRS